MARVRARARKPVTGVFHVVVPGKSPPGSHAREVARPRPPPPSRRGGRGVSPRPAVAETRNRRPPTARRARHRDDGDGYRAAVPRTSPSPPRETNAATAAERRSVVRRHQWCANFFVPTVFGRVSTGGRPPPTHVHPRHTAYGGAADRGNRARRLTVESV